MKKCPPKYIKVLFDKLNEFHFLIFLAPPPPANFNITGVTRTSAILEWSMPLYHGAYKITKFIAQYKKEGTNLGYYDAVSVSSAKSKTTVKGLNVGAKYLMQMVSVNAYGSLASDPVEMETLQKRKCD